MCVKYVYKERERQIEGERDRERVRVRERKREETFFKIYVNENMSMYVRVCIIFYISINFTERGHFETK